MDNKEALILLNMIKGVTSIRAKKLLDNFPDPKEIFKASAKTLRQVNGFSEAVVQRIISGPKEIDLEEEISLIKKSGVKLIFCIDKEYPYNLKEIFDPPMVLYVRGEIKESDIVSLAIIGSRNASIYGLNTAEKLAEELASLGITIVSGLARGIDSSAHKGALKAKGRTIVVLGSGLSYIYPPENKKLAEEIIRSGSAVISEFPMDTPPHSYNFPRRNRIISGLSLGTVVVEAAPKSGALITAGLALEQGREVFAVPGNVNSLNSSGTNSLIKQGAKLVEKAEDIIEELKPILKNCKKDLKLDKKGFKKEDKKANNLSEEEKVIYQLLDAEPRHIDEITSQCNLSFNQVSSILMNLEIKKAVKQLPGKLFIKN